MSGHSARVKGKSGEYEVIAMLKPVVDKVYKKYASEVPLLERNSLQTNKGGSDIAGLPWLAIEVKRQELLNLNVWWEQAIYSTKKGQVTVLVYRQNRGKWRAQLLAALPLNFNRPNEKLEFMNLDCGNPEPIKVDITIEDFLDWFEQKVEYELLLQIKQERPNPWPPAPPMD